MSNLLDKFAEQKYANRQTTNTGLTRLNSDFERRLYNQYDEPRNSRERNIERNAFWDSVPTVYKQAYNDSIGGMMHEIATGRKYYDVVDMPRGVLFDIGAAFLSMFASKEDAALMLGTGGTANLLLRGAKLGGQQIFKGATQALVGEGVKRKGTEVVISDIAKKRAAIMMSRKLRLGGKPLGIKKTRQIIDDVVIHGGVAAATLGAYDGFYYGAKEARDELLSSGVDLSPYRDIGWSGAFKEVMKNSDPKDFFRGGFLGLAGGVGRTARFLSPLGLGSAKPLQQRTKRTLMGEAAVIGALTPLAYEGRLPQFQDLMLATGTVAALTAPGAVINSLQRKGGRVRDELYERQNKEVGERAVSDFLFTREQKDLYEQIQQPFARTDKLPNYAYQDQNIFKIGRGSFAYTNIFGRRMEIKRGVGDATIAPGDIKGKVEERIQPALRKDNLPFLAAKVVNVKQEKTGLSSIIKVEGQGQFYLDERNTDLFFKFHSENTELIGKFEQNIDGIRNSKIALDKHYDENIKLLREKALKSEDGFVPEDWNQAVLDTVKKYAIDPELKKTGELKTDIPFKEQTTFARWAESLAKGKEVKISDMTLAEKAVMSKAMKNRIIIKDFLEKNFPKYQEDLMFQPAFLQNKKRNALAGFVTPFYQHITDPFLKKGLRILQNVTDSTEQKTSLRLETFKRILEPINSFKPTQKTWWKNWLEGTGEDFAAKDYEQIAKLNRDNPGKGFAIFMKQLDRDIEVSKGVAQERLEMKREFFIDMDKLTSSGTEKDFGVLNIWDDAKSANLELAEKVPGYLPRMFDKAVLDILFDRYATMEKKLMDLRGLDINVDGTYNKEIIDKIESELEGLIRSFNQSKKPEAVAFKKVYDILSQMPSSAGIPKNYNVYRLLSHNLHTNTLKAYNPLEKGRKIANLDYGNNNIMEEIATKGTAQDISDLFETNVIKLYTEYLGGATKRIELSKAFTPSGAYWEQLMQRSDQTIELDGMRLPGSLGGQYLPFAKQSQFEAVRMMKEVFTGEYNFRQELPMTESFQSISNLEMMGKISLGQAFIPNMTQSLISTAMEEGFGSFSRGLYRMITDEPFRRRARYESGSSILTAFDEMFASDRALQIGAAQKMKTGTPTAQFVADWLQGQVKAKDAISYATKKTSFVFSKVNEFNQVVAAATAEESIKKFGRILAGKRDFITDIGGNWAADKRKAWATDKLRRLGLNGDEVVKNLDAIEKGVYATDAQRAFKNKMLLGMKRFARKTQLQRDYLRDPVFFNDPMLKPLLLFKRFGIRQFLYMKDVMKNELRHGNVLPLLRLGVGGFAGGQFVMWAKEEMNKSLTGEREYYGESNRMTQWETPLWQDYANAYSSVGALGVVGDIISDNNPKNAINFFVKPVVIDDFFRVVKAWDAFAASMQTHYPEQWDVPVRKGLNTLAPIGGPVLSRIATRGLELSVPFTDIKLTGQITPDLATENMEREKAEGRKKTILNDVRDAVLNRNSRLAERMTVEWNTSDMVKKYPTLAIKGSDLAWRHIEKKFNDRIRAQQEEYQYIP